MLGGLISEQVTGSEQRVPFLGHIPLIGELFKVRNTQKHKSNLMFFIRPKILRDGVQTAIETNSKYNNLRDQQLKLHNGKAPLLPFEKQPALPAVPPASPPASGTPPVKPEAPPAPAPARDADSRRHDDATRAAPASPPETPPPTEAPAVQPKPHGPVAQPGG